MSTDSILLGLVESSSDFTTASGTFVLRTGLSATVTVPSGGRKVKVTVGFRTIYMAGGTNGTATVSVWDGTVGSGTQLGERTYRLQDAAFEVSPTPMFFQSPSAGSKTYNVGVKTTAGTIGFQGTAAGQAFILVEAL